MHGGQILIESEYKKGSTFIVKIPLDDSILKLDHVEIAKDNTLKNTNFVIEKEALLYDLRNMDYSILSDDTMPDRAQNQVILIVEDNKTLRKQIHDELADRYIVREAVNGAEGLEKAKKYMPDLIITDIMMPEMDGVEMCRRIKTNINTSHIPILMLSAKASAEHQIEGLNTGADDYISKPFNLDLLLAKINSILKTREGLRKRYRNQLSIIPEEITVTNADENILKRLLEIIEENLSNPDLSANTFVTQIGMSRSVLYAKLKELTGQSVNEFVRTVKLKKASQVMVQNQKNISEVAYMFGFNTPQYFTKCFKEEFGIPPKDFIARHTEKKQN